MLLQGVQKVCCCVIKLISFEIYEQNTAKKATIEDYLANFVITINTLRHSSQAAKKFVIVNITRLSLNNRNQICPKKPLFKKLLQILRIWSSICCAIKTECCAIKTACCGKISTPCQILTPPFLQPRKKCLRFRHPWCIHTIGKLRLAAWLNVLTKWSWLATLCSKWNFFHFR